MTSPFLNRCNYFFLKEKNIKIEEIIIIVSIFFLSTCDKIAFSYYKLETYEIVSYYTQLVINHLTNMEAEINEAIIKKNYQSKWLLDGLDIFKDNISWFAKLNYYSARNYYYLGMIAY